MVLGRRKEKEEEEWDGVDRRAVAKVLVVNDDPAACEMLVRMVAAKGFEAVGAPASDEAIARMADELPRCVVLDLDTGGMGTSLKVLDTIRTHDDLRVRSARVVLCAGSPRNRVFSFQSGTDAFLVRPFHLDELTDQIADVVARPQEDRARHRRDELARHGD
jgi:DNA-binding response OmpR family regulator